MEDFLHYYEMESLDHGITARKDIIREIQSRFPDIAEESWPDNKAPTWSLQLEGNSRHRFTNRIRNIHVVALAGSLIKSRLPGLQVLNLSFNHLGEKIEVSEDESKENEEEQRRFALNAIPSISRLLQDTSGYACALEKLDLSGNWFGGVSCKLLCDVLAHNKTLKSLNLRGNPLGEDGGHAVAALLSSDESKLEVLDIGNTQLETANIIAIATALRANTTLRDLNLDNPIIRSKEEEMIQHIGRMLRVNETLQRLSLAKHGLTDDGVKVLADRLLDNETLQGLGLRANRFGATGAEALASLLLEHSSLVEFDCSANRLGDEGACAFGHLLEMTTRPLLTLSLCSTYLTDKGLAILAESFHLTSKVVPVRNLLLWDNDFGPDSSSLFYSLQTTYFADKDIRTDFQAYCNNDNIIQIAHQDLDRAQTFESPKR